MVKCAQMPNIRLNMSFIWQKSAIKNPFFMKNFEFNEILNVRRDDMVDKIGFGCVISTPKQRYALL